MVDPKGVYAHYKRPDRLYLVIGCGENRTQPGPREVCYMALYDDPDVERFHFRTVDEFTSLALKPDGTRVPRFSRMPGVTQDVIDRVCALSMDLVHGDD